jgi:hypothetical protein
VGGKRQFRSLASARYAGQASVLELVDVSLQRFLLIGREPDFLPLPDGLGSSVAVIGCSHRSAHYGHWRMEPLSNSTAERIVKPAGKSPNWTLALLGKKRIPAILDINLK